MSIAAEYPQGGILLVDKAGEWTSHDVVAKSRRALGTRKVGHAGTLDPMATGLLVLGFGPATRLLTHLVGLDKTYETTIRLGANTVTDDREGEVLDISDADAVRAVAADSARIATGITALTGAIEQAPSAVSAIKVDGVRAYDRVRAGEQVELKKRPVTIHRFTAGDPQLTEAAVGPVVSGDDVTSDIATETAVAHTVIDIDAVVDCSSGTYIRALARDLGADLGIGGHLTALRRTAVGPFRVTDANPLAELAAGRIGKILGPAEVAATLFPTIELDAQQTLDLGNGKRVELGTTDHDAPLVAAIGPAIIPAAGPTDPAGAPRLVGLIEIKRGRARVITNFPVPEGNAA
ncbi:tRNA pseudouridine(55) synthase TruB [Leucobacter sp. CX42]|uniref:tRNA pseudouridine(55) synthase TruB n=1 Tax=unclassified Leucobacter TaxID=2621730 RepID=UPI0033421CE1